VNNPACHWRYRIELATHTCGAVGGRPDSHNITQTKDGNVASQCAWEHFELKHLIDIV